MDERISKMYYLKLMVFHSMILVTACATKTLETRFSSIEKREADFRMKQEDSLRRIEDLADSILVLQDRLETLKVAVERNAATSQPTVELKKTVMVSSVKKLKSVGVDKNGDSFFGVGEIDDQKLPKRKWTNKDLFSSFSQQEKKSVSESEMRNKNEDRRVDNPEAIQVYNTAFKKFESKQFLEAIRFFETFLSRFPDHVYADNAAFWIGESHFQLHEYQKAVDQFERVAREFPLGNKVPDALLKAGFCYLKLLKHDPAKGVFVKLVELYPQSIAAQEAKVVLSEFKERSTGNM